MKKLTSLEKKWILYDVGNSAFILLVSTIIPIVFNNLAKNHISETDYLAYWGYGITISTVVVGFLGPLLGTISDRKDHKKMMFLISVLVGVFGCAALSFCDNWLSFIIVFIISKIGYSLSLIFYDSMLIDITEKERMDNVSSHGYAWGYIGSTIPFILSLVLIFNLEDTKLAFFLVFFINAIWWLALTLPLYKAYVQVNYSNKKNNATFVFKELQNSLKEILKQRKIFLYLLSFFFYIDGVYTIINMATAYATSLGLDSIGLVIALLVTQVVAFPFSLLFSAISKKYKAETLIKVCIIAYSLITIYAIQLDQLYEFWILAVAVGMFQGAIQALSRSYYAKIIPSDKSGEYFGVFDICGKGASIIGTLIISVVSQITNNQNLALSSLVIMFILGYFIFSASLKEK